MEIKRVKFERLFNYGNYEHIKIGLEADVADQSVLSSVFKSLNEKCEQEFASIQKKKEEEARKADELNDLYYKVLSRKDELKKMFSNRGDEIPF